MKVVPKHFTARPIGGLPSNFLTEEEAKKYAGGEGKIEPVETAYIFDSLKEKEVFETRAMQFSEEIVFLELGLIPSEKGLKLLEELIQKKGVKNVKKLLALPVEKTSMEANLVNRLTEGKVKTVLDVIKINRVNDLLKFRQFGKKTLAQLEEWFEKTGLAFGMFITE